MSRIPFATALLVFILAGTAGVSAPPPVEMSVRVDRPPLRPWAGLAPWWKIAGLSTEPDGLPEGFSYWAVAGEPELQIYGYYGEKAWLWGKIRQGQRVPAAFKAAGDHCKKGNWYETPDEAYLCNTHGYTIKKGSELPQKPQGIRPPALDDPLPYTYFKPKKRPIVQYEQLPTEEERRAAIEAVAKQKALPEVVDSIKEGAFFIALDRKVKGGAQAYYRSIGGHYVRAELMEKVEGPTFRGELLGRGKGRLPMAFVHRDAVPAYKRSKSGLKRQGTAKLHARLHVVRQFKRDKKAYVQGPAKVVLPRDAVRLAQKTSRPKEIEADQKWVHFDLSEQVLVAYEGDRPVFTTLFSSGKEGHDTPAGTYRVYLKQISGRMSGDDAKDGPYDIGEVPWVMYYHKSFAVHGAYWHDTFGNVRSHGCTNLAPADARWIYFWTAPRLPPGWHEMYAKEGTSFHYTE